MQELIG